MRNLHSVGQDHKKQDHKKGARLSTDRASARRRAFTLVEVLVATGILLLLLTVILVPLRLAFDSLNVGRARSDVQQAAQATVSQIADDLRHASFVFPNTNVPTVMTAGSPYALYNSASPLPYVISGDSVNDTNAPSAAQGAWFSGACPQGPPIGSQGMENPARIDMIEGGYVKGTTQDDDYMVSYYPRRLDITSAYDPLSNPEVLFRAQYYFADPNNADTALPFNSGQTASNYNLNANVGTLFPTSTDCSSNMHAADRSSLWLSHNYYGEADLEPLTLIPTPTSGLPGSHALAIPRGMALRTAFDIAVANSTTTVPPFQGELETTNSFICADTTGAGKVNRVTIHMVLQNFASGSTVRNGNPQPQSAVYTQSVDLPNVH